MATHDYIISNASGAAVRADLNNALAAIATNNSSATEPTTTYAYQWWADTGSSPTVMKLRNAANSGWITLFQLDGEWTVVPFENGTAAAPSIYFKDSGTDTGLFSGGTDQVNISTGGTERVEWGTSEVVFNDGGENYDFRIESDTNAQIFFVDASANAVGIGTASPAAALEVVQSSDMATISATSGTSNSARHEIRSGNGTTSGKYAYLRFNNNDTNNQRYDIGTYGTDDLTFRDVKAASTRMTLDTSGRLLVGTSSARNNLFGDSNIYSGFQLEGAGIVPANRFLSIVNNYDTSADGDPMLVLGRTRGSAVGGGTIVQSGDQLGAVSFQGSQGSSVFREAARIQAFVDGTPGANDMPGRLVFSVTADGASSPSTAMTINQNRTLTSEADIFVKGGLFVSDPITTNRYLYKSSSGGGTATVYIGNAAIQVSSDARLKDNIQDTSLSAVEELQKVRVVDFTWNDPSDTSYNNRNARGIWTGVIAQELIDVFPFAVNAPRKEDDLSIDYDSDSTWTVEQQQLVPVLIKAIQEQQAVITNLQDRLSALEAN